MSVWGNVGSAAKKYYHNVNLELASSMIQGGWRNGLGGARKAITLNPGLSERFAGAAMGYGKWAWGGNMAERASRMSFVVGASVGGSMFASGITGGIANTFSGGRQRR